MIGDETSTTTFPCGCRVEKRSRLDVGTLVHCRDKGGTMSRCPHCNSRNVCVFDLNNDICNDCGKWFPGSSTNSSKAHAEALEKALAELLDAEKLHRWRDAEDAGECWQCWNGRHGLQHTNGKCRCSSEFRERRLGWDKARDQAERLLGRKDGPCRT